jgi:phage-related holin
MLEPGLKMVKMIGLFGGFSLAFYCINSVLLSFLFGGLAIALGIILLILIMIEQHQDNVLNQQAINERKKNGED